MADHAISAPMGASNTHAPNNQVPESNRHTSPDAAILAAFKRFQDGYALLASLDDTEKREPGEDLTPGEKKAWDIIDAADTEVHAVAATTPVAIACKLWIALVHSTDDRDEEQAAIRADLEWFEEQGDVLDWHLRHMVSVLRGLNLMEAGSKHDAGNLATDDPISQDWTAFHGHEAGTTSEAEYLAAFEAMHQWTPPTPRDFVRKFEAAYSLGGCPIEENEDRLTEQAVALIGLRAGKEA